MFKRLDQVAGEFESLPMRVTVNGSVVACRQSDSVAAVLLASGVAACRDTAVNEVPRGPFCMMGVCYDCLVTIDGQPNQQACMTPVRDGMSIERQVGARKVQA